MAGQRTRKAGKRERIFDRELRQLREFSEGKDSAMLNEASAGSPAWEATPLQDLASSSPEICVIRVIRGK